MLFKTNTIVGHRGCKLVDQNNTVMAFLRAAEEGAEMVEMDIRRTRDGVLIVFHNPDVDGFRIKGYLYEDLAKKANAVGLLLPTLEYVLEQLEGKIQLDVELKEGGYEREVVSMILRKFTPSEFVVTSFLDQVILSVKRQFPTVKTGLILGVSPINKEFNWRGIRKISQRISEFFPWRRLSVCGADFIAVNWKNLFLGLLKSADKRNIPVFVWTVNKPKQLKKLLESRLVSGIVSDRPDLAVTERNSL